MDDDITFAFGSMGDIAVLFARDLHRWIWRGTTSDPAAILQQIGIDAADCDDPLTWQDAAILTRAIRRRMEALPA